MAQPLDGSAVQYTVVIIDGHYTSRAGLRLVLETEPGVHVVGEASTLADGLMLAEHHRPLAIILDLDLAGTKAVTITSQLTTRFPACIVLLIALLLDPATQAELVSAGAAACVEKDLPGNLLNAFRQALRRVSHTS